MGAFLVASAPAVVRGQQSAPAVAPRDTRAPHAAPTPPPPGAHSRWPHFVADLALEAHWPLASQYRDALRTWVGYGFLVPPLAFGTSVIAGAALRRVVDVGARVGYVPFYMGTTGTQQMWAHVADADVVLRLHAPIDAEPRSSRPLVWFDVSAELDVGAALVVVSWRSVDQVVAAPRVGGVFALGARLANGFRIGGRVAVNYVPSGVAGGSPFDPAFSSSSVGLYMGLER